MMSWKIFIQWRASWFLYLFDWISLHTRSCSQFFSCSVEPVHPLAKLVRLASQPSMSAHQPSLSSLPPIQASPSNSNMMSSHGSLLIHPRWPSSLLIRSSSQQLLFC